MRPRSFHPRRNRRPEALRPYQKEQRFFDVFAHAQRRALQHYGVDVTEPTYRAWCEAIRVGSARYVAPARKAGHVWVVVAGELELFAVFREGLIRTFLPPRAEEVRLAEEAFLADLLPGDEPADE